MSNSNQEIVFEGWLTKSPPTKRIWKARWRRRWFVLKHSGELPMQYFLLYYTGRDCKKLKGTIDLDQCDQVDAGLRFENSKQNYPFMFDIRTPKRTYYLAADSETEMNKWVECVCQVCVLKATIDDSIVIEEENTDTESYADSKNMRPKKFGVLPERNCGDYCNETRNQAFPDSPPVSPTSSVSGPYIPISECVSGKPLNTPKGISDFNNIISRQELNSKMNSKDCFSQPQQSYKLLMPRIQQTICSDDISKCDLNQPIALPMPVPPPKPPVERINSLYEDRKNLNPGREDKITNIESAKKMAERRKDAVNVEFYDCPRKVVADNEWQRPSMGLTSTPTFGPGTAPPPNWSTFPVQEDSDFSPGDIGSWSVVERCGKLTIVDSKAPFLTNSLNRVPRQRHLPETHSLRRLVAPPRPPKPQHLIISEHSQADESCASPRDGSSLSEPSPSPSSSAVMDETYDVPRSHQPHDNDTSARNTYSNANPQAHGNVFRYDFSESDTVHPSSSGETISPRFEGSAIQYSNLPSPPGAATPPAVNRELKPCRKMSESGASSEPSPGPFTPGLGTITTSSAESSPIGFGPPSIDRTLKPKKPHQEGMIQLARPPDSKVGGRRVRAGPSPTPSYASSAASKAKDPRSRSPIHDQMYLTGSAEFYPEGIQYLDLDLDADVSNAAVGPPVAGAITTCTAYKTIDFLKTKAFNQTREEIEEMRKERND